MSAHAAIATNYYSTPVDEGSKCKPSATQSSSSFFLVQYHNDTLLIFPWGIPIRRTQRPKRRLERTRGEKKEEEKKGGEGTKILKGNVEKDPLKGQRRRSTYRDQRIFVVSKTPPTWTHRLVTGAMVP